MQLDFFYVAGGLVALLAGGEALVRGALGLSARFGVSPAVIGAVVMGFGTSSPELAASVTAVFNDAPGIALGNVIGSNIANIALILGLVVLLVPLAVSISRVDRIALVVASVVLVVPLALGEVGRLFGLACLVGLGLYLVIVLRQGQTEEVAADPAPGWRSAAFTIGGLVLLVAGAQALVSGGLGLAERFGVPPAIVGLTVVAVGTSLPELMASLVAAFRGQGGLAIGNIVGSNIFNALGILGLTAVLHPISVPPAMDWAEAAAVLSSAAALLAMAWLGRAGRLAGCACLLGYGIYAVTLV